MERMTNWAGNLAYRAAGIQRPRTVEEVQGAVLADPKVRALGTRHSFSSLADTAGVLLSMEHMNAVIGVDAEKRVVTAEAGITYGKLGEFLQEQGWALRNLASLPHISVAGAVATGTHGSGETLGSLATGVVEMELVNAAGEICRLSRRRDPEIFAGAVVALGALGVVTKVGLEVVPTFEVRQEVFEGLEIGDFLGQFAAIEASAYSVSFFTDWTNQECNQIWLKRRAGDERGGMADLGRAAEVERHPILACSPENCTPQLGVAGPWHERLPHFRMDFTPSSGDELQSEYLVPRERAEEAIAAVAALAERITPLLLITEIRTVAGDDLWLSPCYGRDSAAIHFTWKPLGEAVHHLLPAIEAALEPFAARPHWGKIFVMEGKKLRSLYPRAGDFLALVRTMDPEGKFWNEYLERCLGAGAGKD